MSSVSYCSEIKLYVLRLKEDSPRASTALKLIKLGLAHKLYRPERISSKLIVLDPFAEETISKDDLGIGIKGIVVVDRSWNRLLSSGGRLMRYSAKLRRRLPFFIAANPINYMQAQKLSSAEALAAAMIVLGCEDRAKDIMSKFKWGGSFFTINRQIIEAYLSAKSREELLHIEREMMRKVGDGSWRGS